MEKHEDFGERVIVLGQKAIGIMDEYLDGKRSGTDKIKEASTLIREAGKIWNRQKMDYRQKQSQAIQLLKVIPKASRDDFLGAMIPEVKPFLLDRPEKISKTLS